jgi:hypothetical protein
MPSGHQFTSRLLTQREPAGSLCSSATRPHPFVLQPALEVTAPGHMETFQQVALVQLQSPGWIIRLDSCLKLHRVARQRLEGDPYLLVTPAR